MILELYKTPRNCSSVVSVMSCHAGFLPSGMTNVFMRFAENRKVGRYMQNASAPCVTRQQIFPEGSKYPIFQASASTRRAFDGFCDQKAHIGDSGPFEFKILQIM